jgi:fermentation-respiration switch protein FrsA (DUF1100 family)
MHRAAHPPAGAPCSPADGGVPPRAGSASAPAPQRHPGEELLRLFRTDLEKKVAANHARIRVTTTDIARIGGAKVNARWTREFLDHDPREDLRRIAVPVLALTGEKDLQVDPADVDTVAALVRGPVEVHRVPELTHTLRRQEGPPSLGAYRKELRESVNQDVLATVVQWCRRVTDRAVEPPRG